mmetsp:Transcript_14134/g.31203  ORF Transcript_14134/g.31203 Transcript_14134/m.31203 type:complete len:268 (-) Transcript_14134:1295-2098(-)
MAATLALTAVRRSDTLAPAPSPPPPTWKSSNASRSEGIWYFMKSCMRSWVSFISLVRLSGLRRRTRSSWGLICTTHTAKRVLSSCMLRKACAKRLCSGDRDSMDSLNSWALGMRSRSKGIVNSSRFWAMNACCGRNRVDEAMRPMSTTKLLNCLEEATRLSWGSGWAEKWCAIQPCRWRSPPNCTVVDALRANSIRPPPPIPPIPAPAPAMHLDSVKMGSPAEPPDPCASCIFTAPSGEWAADLRTAWLKGVGRKASLMTLRLWKTI